VFEQDLGREEGCGREGFGKRKWRKVQSQLSLGIPDNMTAETEKTKKTGGL